MTGGQERRINVQGYDGLNPEARGFPAGLQARLKTAITAAEALTGGTQFTFREAPPGRTWDFPPGVQTVFQFTSGSFTHIYEVHEGAQYIGSFSSTDVANTGRTRTAIAEAFGYNSQTAMTLRDRPIGLPTYAGVRGTDVYYAPRKERSVPTTGTVRRGRPRAGSVQINNYRIR